MKEKKKIHRIFLFFKHANSLNTFIIIIRRFRFDFIGFSYPKNINKRIFMMIYSNFSRMFEGKNSTKINESILLFGDLGEKGKKLVAVY